jgi:tetratricopeptide (TPR) repeat protein
MFGNRNEMRYACFAGLALAAMLAAAAPMSAAEAPAAPEGIDAQLAKALASLDQPNLHAAALDTIEKVLADKAATTRQKLDAVDIAIAIRDKQRKKQEVADLADRLIRDFPDNLELVARGTIVQADAIWEAKKKREDAIEKLEAFLAKVKDNKAAAAMVHARLAKYFRESGKGEIACQHAKAAADAGTLGDRQAIEVLRLLADACLERSDLPGCEAALARVLAPKYLAAIPGWERAPWQDRYGDVLRKQKKYAEARAFYRKSDEGEKDPRRRQRVRIHLGDMAVETKEYDQALEAYERVFVDEPTVADSWIETQEKIADTLKARGDFAGALKAARVSLDSASEAGYVIRETVRVAEILKAIDKHVGRANAFILFQKFGPAGEDGKPGTPDDLTNPLADAGYPTYPLREKAFEAARKAAADDAEASRFRAATWLYCGRPKDALRCYLDALARCRLEEYPRYAREAVIMGVRPVQGHAHGLERFYDYLAYGPAGPDGKLNTDDDLKDPFLELGMKREELYGARLGASGVERLGGAADISDEDVRTIRKAAAVLREMAVNEIEQLDTRRTALEALVRLRTALLDWSDCGADWCLQEMMRHAEDPRHVAIWAAAGQWAARGADCHLGGARDFWRRLDAQPLPAEGRKGGELDRLRQELPRAAEQLAKTPSVVPKALKTVVLTKLDYRPPEIKPLAEDPKKP